MVDLKERAIGAGFAKVAGRHHCGSDCGSTSESVCSKGHLHGSDCIAVAAKFALMDQYRRTLWQP
jgi:hypothetical protein